MAAAALMLSININGSPCAQLMGANSTLYFLKERGHYYKPPGQQQMTTTYPGAANNAGGVMNSAATAE